MSKKIIVDIGDIQSVVSLHNDDLGEQDQEGNVIAVEKHIDEATGELVKEGAAFTLPGDAFRDRVYMDWLLSDKSGQETTIDDYNDLMHK